MKTFPTEPIEHLRVDKITDEKLDENAVQFNQFVDSIDVEVTDEEVESARRVLSSLPLVHRTGHRRFDSEPYTDDTLYDSLVPHSYLPDGQDNNTYPLDQQMNLDEYVFLQWGAVDPHGDNSGFLQDARFALLVSPELLVDDQTIVSPHDIAMLAGDFLYDGVGFASADEVQQLKIYLDTILRGSDWAKIMPKYFAKALKKSGGSIKLNPEMLGEVKFHGEVPRSYIMGTVDLDDPGEYDHYCDYVTTITDGRVQLAKSPKMKHKILGIAQKFKKLITS